MHTKQNVRISSLTTDLVLHQIVSKYSRSKCDFNSTSRCLFYCEKSNWSVLALVGFETDRTCWRRIIGRDKSEKMSAVFNERLCWDSAHSLRIQTVQSKQMKWNCISHKHVSPRNHEDPSKYASSVAIQSQINIRRFCNLMESWCEFFYA